MITMVTVDNIVAIMIHVMPIIMVIVVTVRLIMTNTTVDSNNIRKSKCSTDTGRSKKACKTYFILYIRNISTTLKKRISNSNNRGIKLSRA